METRKNNNKRLKKLLTHYTIFPTKKQLKIIKRYWNDLQHVDSVFSKVINQLEVAMEKETGIKGIEFFMCDNEYVGIGNADRTMRLIQLR